MAHTADVIIALERRALERWGSGDPGGFLDLYADDISYFDPLTAARLDGHQTMAGYYAPFAGKIRVDRFEMRNADVVVDGNMAVLTYNLVNFLRDAGGVESVANAWNSTTVFRRQGGEWKSIHSHWSFTRHPAFQSLTVETSEVR